jgi:2-succinyl-6-hydroxy-2,4-cyclohexadiene-1-carboxylate synthase
MVESLVLVSSTAGIDDPVERAARRAADERLAEELERNGVDQFLDRWLAQPLFVTLPSERSGRDERRANTVAGLASSLRLAGTGSQESLWSRLAELHTVPVLIIAGSNDTKFVAIGERMAELIGATAKLVVLPGRGHACHLEAPEEFNKLLSDFFRKT